MADIIYSSDLIRYNANNRGNNTTDCVARAISFAFDVPYIKITQQLNAKMHEKHLDSYKRPNVYDDIIKEYGGPRSTKPERNDITLSDFADAHASGVYLVTTGNKPDTHNHLVCIVDGTVYDSWDSRKAYVYNYYSITGRVHKEITDISQSMRTLAYEARQCIEEEGEKNGKKYQWEDFLLEVDDEALIVNYNITIEFQLTVRFATGLKKFTFPIVFVFSPTTTEEEAHKIIKNTAKVRVYDRFYAVNQKYKEAIAEKAAQEEVSGKILNRNDIWDGTERKFYDSLPGWVKGRLRRLYIQSPGQYSDSYSLSIYPLAEWPVDSEFLDYSHALRFEGYTSSDVKDMLNRYKTKGEVEGRDYYYSEEY